MNNVESHALGDGKLMPDGAALPEKRTDLKTCSGSPPGFGGSDRPSQRVWYTCTKAIDSLWQVY